jgi:hypothetical protein
MIQNVKAQASSFCASLSASLLNMTATTSLSNVQSTMGSIVGSLGNCLLVSWNIFWNNKLVQFFQLTVINHCYLYSLKSTNIATTNSSSASSDSSDFLACRRFKTIIKLLVLALGQTRPHLVWSLKFFWISDFKFKLRIKFWIKWILKWPLLYCCSVRMHNSSSSVRSAAAHSL